VLIADYWIVRRRQLALEDLYLSEGRYGAWNLTGILATLAGCVVAWIGLVYEPLRPLFDYAWFIGFAVAGGAYLLFARRPA
jgi:NCS1 family nucleobase:cation symporter-1